METGEDSIAKVQAMGESIKECAIPYLKLKEGFRNISDSLKKMQKELLISDLELKRAAYAEICNHRDKASFLIRWLWNIRVRKAKRAIDEAVRKLVEFSNKERNEEKKD